jgi:hypothetical protein
VLGSSFFLNNPQALRKKKKIRLKKMTSGTQKIEEQVLTPK